MLVTREQVAAVLENPAFNAAFQEVFDNYNAALLESSETQKDFRESMYHRLKALTDVKKEMVSAFNRLSI